MKLRAYKKLKPYKDNRKELIEILKDLIEVEKMVKDYKFDIDIDEDYNISLVVGDCYYETFTIDFLMSQENLVNFLAGEVFYELDTNEEDVFW